MSMVNDKVLSAVILLQRVIPRLKANDRSTISRQNLMHVQQTISMVIQQLLNDCTKPLVLTPLMEIVQLIEDVTADETFVETDAETKNLIVDRANTALSQLYLFAGEFYMTHEFTWTLTKTDVLRTIVDACIDLGFYFGYDKDIK